MKRFCAALGVCMACMLGSLATGCQVYDSSDLAETTATPGDAEKEGDAGGSGSKTDDEGADNDGTGGTGAAGGVDMTELRDYSQLPTKKFSWYIVRNSDHKISGCDENFELEQYDAYYADRVCGENDEKVMYLTFDCGYENGYTEQILDVLKKHNAKGCFFVTMTYIRDNPDIVRRMKEEGHLVGNHTVHHPSMPEISVDEQKEELSECAAYMKETTGYDMDMYFRPPCGEYSEQVLQLAKDMGYETIFWSMAYLDYDVDNQPGADYVIEHFSKYCHPGAIPLIHNVSSSNAEALDTVLTNLEREGYSFKSLDELNRN